MKNNRIKHKKHGESCRMNGLLKTGLLITAMVMLTFRIAAQPAAISLNMKDTTVQAVIEEIRKQTDISFVYNHEELANCPKISIEAVNEPVESILKRSLKNTGLTYKKVNDTFVITPLPPVQKKPVEPAETLSQMLRGLVIDRDSRTTLPFATVIIVDSDPVIGTVTDADGNFTLEDLSPGRYAIKISYVGYEDAILPEIPVGTAKEAFVTVELSERMEEIGEINVTVKKGEPVNGMATVSAQSFSVDETQRYAASISDPARMAQVFAGVSGNDDASNEIVIRGNSPQWMQWRLEGIEIPSPNHFAEEGYTAGAVSILSANMMSTSDFYTGAFPAEYGNALSGVFDMRFRNGNNQKREYTFQAGVLGLDLSAEGPFAEGYTGSYLFNYRYSTLSLLNIMNITVSENALPNYQDLSFKINLPTKKAGTFAIFGIGGISDVDEKYLPDTTQDEEFKYGYSDYTKTGMYALGLSHTIFPDAKSYIKTVVSQSMSYSSETYQVMDDFGALQDDYFDELQKRAFRINTFYNRKLSERFTMRAGLSTDNLNYDYYTREADSLTGLRTVIDNRGSTNLYQAYIQGKYKFSENIVFSGGLHYSYFALNHDNSLEPRAGIVFHLPKKQKLSFGVGLHTKHDNLPLYFVEFENPDGSTYMPNKTLEMTRSTHYVASYEKLFGEHLNLKVSTYYQDINNLPVSVNPDKYWSSIDGGVNIDDTLANIGKGRNIGVEFTLQKYFTNDYYFLISNSFFDSKYRTASGEWRNTRYNINYINNFVGGKEFHWGNNKLVGVNAKFIWSGGKRLVPLDLEASIDKGEAVYKTDESWTVKGDDYLRLDIGARLHFFKAKSEHVISLDIQNVTNRLNTWAQLYDAENEQIAVYPMAGLIPVLSYRISF
jgi:hypothetical protein